MLTGTKRDERVLRIIGTGKRINLIKETNFNFPLVGFKTTTTSTSQCVFIHPRETLLVW